MIIPIALVVVFSILILLLRSLLAPLLLIGTVILSFAAALGISLVIFDVIFGFAGVDPSFPLFAFIFLVALGIDYNIFLMARVREETARHGTRQGMLRGLAVTGGVITSAGIVLAGTFSVLALLPLVFLTEIGFVIAFGVLLDTFIVRSILVPALVLDIGPKIWWPSRLQHEDGGDRRASRRTRPRRGSAPATGARRRPRRSAALDRGLDLAPAEEGQHVVVAPALVRELDVVARGAQPFERRRAGVGERALEVGLRDRARRRRSSSASSIAASVARSTSAARSAPEWRSARLGDRRPRRRRRPGRSASRSSRMWRRAGASGGGDEDDAVEAAGALERVVDVPRRVRRREHEDACRCRSRSRRAPAAAGRRASAPMPPCCLRRA